MIMIDMPKLQSPFVRVETEQGYVVTPQVTEGFEWVFEDSNVLAVEKLDGTNVSIAIEDGRLVGLRNRTNVIECDNLAINSFIHGVRVARSKGRMPVNTGQHFGELMGPKIQGNFLKLSEPEWFPFEFLKTRFAYKSFHNYPKTFENISSWFKNDIFSLVYAQFQGGEKVQPEGIVFLHQDGRMAKLRLDMFDWWAGRRHKEE